MYSIHPSIAYMQTVINNLAKTTGKDLQEWLALVSQAGPKTEKELRLWLIKNFDLGNTTAGIIAHRALNLKSELDADEYLKTASRYVEEMYSGNKKHLRHLHDALIDLALSLYPELKISPCKTIVPFYRNHVIAQIKPSTKDRIDFGLSLRGIMKPSQRLLETGGANKGDRITHRIEIRSLSQIDNEVTQWLKQAYELDA